VENHYDEYGEAIVAAGFKVTNLVHPDQYYSMVDKASPLQIVGLIFTISSALILSFYSCYLQKKLYYRVPWRPPKRVTSPVAAIDDNDLNSAIDPRTEAGRLSRINSGIVAMRSQSLERESAGSYVGHLEDHSTLPSLHGAFT
jgi:hypothetical protein